MLMALTGTPEAEEKEYIFTTPLVHGLSYKLLKKNSNLLKEKVVQCYKYLDKVIEKIDCGDIYNTDDLVKQVVSGKSDLWISVDKNDKIKGCLIIGVIAYPQLLGVSAEAVGGKFDFYKLVPMLEKHYKNLGYEFFEMTGRKGWIRKMEPLGYTLKTVTIRKRL